MTAKNRLAKERRLFYLEVAYPVCPGCKQKCADLQTLQVHVMFCDKVLSQRENNKKRFGDIQRGEEV